eukprot:CAMPEP_0205903914 /NCGR_PEP_ID=MMETSP1325-20131115/396_1 /ASSEMBLY_ACC=CAM_ASM_000708 /TAXON_ID=236786 /ORGANISM="Florenciella sp., Strain RCC1007" /LENGTH=81 /DNA_ID=CAMNT_0053269621 /DNA_START=612 /DNA_END=857 /DNA_ORIENTATION=-
MSERVADPSHVGTPPRNEWVWIRPEQVAQQPVFWHLSRAVQIANQANLIELGRQTAMHTEYLVRDNSSQRHAVEAVAKDSP